jgi:hypothetical protein
VLRCTAFGLHAASYLTKRVVYFNNGCGPVAGYASARFRAGRNSICRERGLLRYRPLPTVKSLPYAGAVDTFDQLIALVLRQTPA